MVKRIFKYMWDEHPIAVVIAGLTTFFNIMGIITAFVEGKPVEAVPCFLLIVIMFMMCTALLERFIHQDYVMSVHRYIESVKVKDVAQAAYLESMASANKAHREALELYAKESTIQRAYIEELEKRNPVVIARIKKDGRH